MGVQRLSQQNGGPRVAAHVFFHRGKTEGGGLVMFKRRGAVDDGIHMAKFVDDLRQQIAHGHFVC